LVPVRIDELGGTTVRVKAMGAGLGVTAVLAAAAFAPGAASAQDICVSTTEDLGTVCSSMVVPYAQSRVTCVETYGAAAVTRCVPDAGQRID
jgi:hypothetical protein